MLLVGGARGGWVGIFATCTIPVNPRWRIRHVAPGIHGETNATLVFSLLVTGVQERRRTNCCNNSIAILKILYDSNQP